MEINMSNKPVIVYGGSGYTGKLIMEYLRHYDIPFIAAGRSRERVENAVKMVPGIETADYEIVEVEHTVEALTELFTGAEVVCNTVGPYVYYCEEVVQACINANTHYLDCGGDTPTVQMIDTKYGAKFTANNKIAAPSTAYMFTILEIAARKVLETPGIDSLDATCGVTLDPSPGSAQTILALFKDADSSFRLENNQRVYWPPGVAYEVTLPDRASTVLGHPWGGGTLPYYFEKDPSVRHVRQLTAPMNRELVEGVVHLQQLYEAEIKDLPTDEKEARLAGLAAMMQADPAPGENPLNHRCVDFVYGRGTLKSTQCIIRSACGYKLTGAVQAATANFLINGQQKTSGFASACEAVGHNELFAQLESTGLIGMETR
jgi:hypothetical protein